MNERISNFQVLPVTITPVLDTSAYVASDVLFVPVIATLQSVLGADHSIRAEVVGATIIDKSANAGLFDLVFFESLPTTFGALNAAVGLSSADALLVKRLVPVTAYTALKAATNGIAQPSFDPFTIAVPAGALGFYVGAISRDTKTYAASDLVITLHVRLHNMGLS